MVKKVVTYVTKDGRAYSKSEDAESHEMALDARADTITIIRSLTDSYSAGMIHPDKLLAELFKKDSPLLAVANQYQQNYYKKT